MDRSRARCAREREPGKSALPLAPAAPAGFFTLRHRSAPPALSVSIVHHPLLLELVGEGIEIAGSASLEAWMLDAKLVADEAVRRLVNDKAAAQGPRPKEQGALATPSS